MSKLMIDRLIGKDRCLIHHDVEMIMTDGYDYEDKFCPKCVEERNKIHAMVVTPALMAIVAMNHVQQMQNVVATPGNPVAKAALLAAMAIKAAEDISKAGK